MIPPDDFISQRFASSIATFANDLDRRAAERYPALLAEMLTAHGMAPESLSPRERALADAVYAACLQMTGEVVGLALRSATDLIRQALAEARLAFPT
jgi:hypothetical protein